MTKRKVLNNLFILTLIASAICTSVGYIFSDDLIFFIGGRNEIFQYGTSYLKVIFLGSIFSISGIAANIVIRSEGKILLATFYTSISVLANIFINLVFVKVINLGITGIAFATVISMLIFSFLNLRYLINNQNLSISLNTLLYENIFSVQLVKEVIEIGISAMFIETLILFQHSLIFKVIASNGTDRDIALIGASLKAFLLAMNIASGFSISFQPIAGINYGAKNYSRVKKKIFNFVFCLWGIHSYAYLAIYAITP